MLISRIDFYYVYVTWLNFHAAATSPRMDWWTATAAAAAVPTGCTIGNAHSISSQHRPAHLGLKRPARAWASQPGLPLPACCGLCDVAIMWHVDIACLCCCVWVVCLSCFPWCVRHPWLNKMRVCVKNVSQWHYMHADRYAMAYLSLSLSTGCFTFARLVPPFAEDVTKPNTYFLPK